MHLLYRGSPSKAIASAMKEGTGVGLFFFQVETNVLKCLLQFLSSFLYFSFHKGHTKSIVIEMPYIVAKFAAWWSFSISFSILLLQKVDGPLVCASSLCLGRS